MKRHKVVTIIGTRPEAIKMAPVVQELNRRQAFFDHRLVSTAQHREMLDQVLEVFGLQPYADLALMQNNQSLGGFASRALAAISELLSEMKPDLVLLQGDTTTVTIAALGAFYQGVTVGHVEAGLRSFDLQNPFPEEMNRRIAACLTSMHFAPTGRARLNLLREGVADENIFVTGNTIVDALRSVAPTGCFQDERLNAIDFEHHRVLLVTAHRRENHGAPLRSICQALRTLSRIRDDIEIIYPVHLNPNVSTVVREELGGIENIHLLEPVSYSDLLRLMNRCYLILTDSGGIQEEAPSLRKPVLILRETTERPEVVEVGAGKIVGTQAQRIIEETVRLLNDTQEYEVMCRADNPFGDGCAAKRIVDIVEQRLQG